MMVLKLVTVECYSCRGVGYDGLDKDCQECYGEGSVIEWRDNGKGA